MKLKATRLIFLQKMLHPLSNSTGLNLANCSCDLRIKRKHNGPTGIALVEEVG